MGHGRGENRQMSEHRSAKKERPRLTTASIATLTAATGEVLTEFTSFRPVNLGHPEKLCRAGG